MLCPGCRRDMDHVTVDGVLGVPVGVEVCRVCRAFWFVPFETVHLTAASTLKLFSLIADGASTPQQAFPTENYCPVCGMKLLLTHDRQRNTPFQYWRCDHEHGRFTPFVDFLREKDFIHPLSPAQIADLKQNIQEIHCTNCGAPIDLTHDSVCSHCGAPISMLDMNKMAELAKQSGKPAAAASVPQLTPATLIPEYRPPEFGSFNLVDLGLQTVADWLHSLIE